MEEKERIKNRIYQQLRYIGMSKSVSRQLIRNIENDWGKHRVSVWKPAIAGMDNRHKGKAYNYNNGKVFDFTRFRKDAIALIALREKVK